MTSPLFTVLPNPVGDGVSNALCKIFNPGSAEKCDKQPKSADEKYKPKVCTTRFSYNQYGVDLDVSLVRVGQNLSFLKTKTSDGKITLTAIEGGKLGVQGSVGAGVHFGKGINVGGDLGGGRHPQRRSRGRLDVQRR